MSSSGDQNALATLDWMVTKLENGLGLGERGKEILRAVAR